MDWALWIRMRHWVWNPSSKDGNRFFISLIWNIDQQVFCWYSSIYHCSLVSVFRNFVLEEVMVFISNSRNVFLVVFLCMNWMCVSGKDGVSVIVKEESLWFTCNIVSLWPSSFLSNSEGSVLVLWMLLYVITFSPLSTLTNFTHLIEIPLCSRVSCMTRFLTKDLTVKNPWCIRYPGVYEKPHPFVFIYPVSLWKCGFFPSAVKKSMKLIIIIWFLPWKWKHIEMADSRDLFCLSFALN